MNAKIVRATTTGVVKANKLSGNQPQNIPGVSVFKPLDVKLLPPDCTRNHNQ